MLKFKRSRLLISALIYLGSLQALFAQEFNWHAATGSYAGQVLNGGDYDPIVTTFTVSASGKLVGSYIIDDESGETLGTLASTIVEGPYTLTMEWTDKDGEGLIQITFSHNYQQFDGYWGTRSSPQRYPLDGKK